MSDTAPGTIEVSLDARDFTWGEVHYVLGIELVELTQTGVASHVLVQRELEIHLR